MVGVRRIVQRRRAGGLCADGSRAIGRLWKGRRGAARGHRRVVSPASRRTRAPARCLFAGDACGRAAGGRGERVIVDHASAAEKFNANPERVTWHDATLWYARENRDRAAAEVPEWETLRELASAIKEHTLSHLDEYLVMFERAAIANGAIVHWARNADEHNAIVHGILHSAGARRLVKSKSMLTEECHLNPYLEARGIDVVDTDLGERIVQLRREPPSHIVAPAIHLKREDIAETFVEHLGTEPGEHDPLVLVAAARVHFRKPVLAAQAGLTGVELGVAGAGGIVGCTNEGHAGPRGAAAPHPIPSIGNEKLLPPPGELVGCPPLLPPSRSGR